MAKQRIRLSLCEFQDGTFELYIIDPATSEEVQIDGRREFSPPQRALLERLMPPCVWTTYEREAI
jgi:hypothetical protein